MNTKREVLKNISQKQLTDLVKDMIKIKCEPEQGIFEAELAEFLAGVMNEMGLEAHLLEKEKGRPSVLGKLPGVGKGTSILFNGHLAAFKVEPWTVDPYGGVIEEGKLYGVGAVDMKSQIAAMIVAMNALGKSGVKLAGDVLSVFSAGAEEAGLIGTKYALDEGTRADMAIVGEPTNLDIVFAQRGATWIEVITNGVSGLTVKAGTINAIYKMIDVVLALQEHDKEIQKMKHPVIGRPKLSVNYIDLPKVERLKPYLVPDKCRIIVDRRMVPGEKSDNVIAAVKKAIQKVEEEDKEQRIEMKVMNTFEPVEISPEERIVKMAQKVMTEVTGEKPKLRGAPGFTESLWFILAGIPTIVCGAGSVEFAHTPNEHISIDQLLSSAKFYALVALEAVGESS